MTVLTCVDCTTRYAVGLDACPHCGSTSYEAEGVAVKRLPLFVSVSCPVCGRGPWTVRMPSITSGLIDLPTLACASCGSRVPVTWPPEEEPMSPKISAHGGATNARVPDVSPVGDASQPLAVAEDSQGLPTSEMAAAPVPAEVTSANDYDGMTLAELRDAAGTRGLPTYGAKAQLIERLRDNDEKSVE